MNFWAKNQKFLFLISVIVLFFSKFIFAYDETIVHPSLTEEAAKFYNLNFGEKLTEQEIGWINQGSVDEDKVWGGIKQIRSSNHFYNPSGVKEWKDYNINDKISAHFSSGTGIGSKQWAHDSVAQSQYVGGDYTWERAIWDFTTGDKKHAYESLGHILHLIEDKTVPAHTRNDFHLSPKELEAYQNWMIIKNFVDYEPYESWTGKEAEKGSLNFSFARNLFQENKKPIILNNLDAYFDNVAAYANTKFFSQDTIYVYSEPNNNVIEEKEKLDNGKIEDYAYGFDENAQKFKLAKIFEDINTKQKTYGISDDTPDIHSDYWSRLAPKSIQAGAGIIKLFKDEVKKAESNPLAVKKPDTFAGFYFINPANQTASEIKSVTGGVYSALKNTVQETLTSAETIFAYFSPGAISQTSTSPLPLATKPNEDEEETSATETEIKQSNLAAVNEQQNNSQAATRGPPIMVKPPQLTLAEIQEQLDDIFEKIDLLKQEVVVFIKTPEKEIISRESPRFQENKEKKTEISFEEPSEAELESEAEEPREKTREETSEKENETIASPSPPVCEKIPGSYPSENKIIINEIAWMGTSASANDEWIELKNISGEAISLAEWQLADKTKNIKIIFNAGVMPAGGFYLLERTNDDTLPNLKADKIYTGGLKDGGEALYLFDDNCRLQDESTANPNWPAGENNSKKTMERKSDLSWQTSENAGGTPKKENSLLAACCAGSPAGAATSPDNSQPATSASLTLPKILISQIAAGWDKAENEFIELYNPNEQSISLNDDNFKLKLADSSGKITAKQINWIKNAIPAKSHFLFVSGKIGKSGGTTLAPDATFANQLSDAGGVIIIDGENNIKDKAGWGKIIKPAPAETVEGEEIILEQGLKTGKSLARQKDDKGDFIDADNNASDFRLKANPAPANSLGQKMIFDEIPPETILENSPPNPDQSSEAVFTFKSGDADSVFECSLDNGQWSACVSPKSYGNLILGSHQFKVRAIDGAENIDETPIIFNWTIEAPQIPPAPETQKQPQTSQKQSLPLKILIAEIQITGGAGKTENDFIELYNPNNAEVNLNGYRLVKRTKNGISDASVKSWINDVYIPANGYYLWANGDYTDISIAADTTTGEIISDNNGVALRFGNENTGTIIDSVGWGEAQNIFIENSVFPTNPSPGQSAGRKWDGQKQEYSDTDDNSADFEIQEPTPKAENKKLGESPAPKQEKQSPPATETIPAQQDKTPPEIIKFEATKDASNPLRFALSWAATDPTISGISASGIEIFSLEYAVTPATDGTATPAIDGVALQYLEGSIWRDFRAGSEGTLMLNSGATAIDFLGKEEKEYFFKLKARDKNGNKSGEAEVSLKTALAKTVVINEIAWMGTNASADDEWIELYNNTDNEINLKGWILKSADGSPFINLSKTIPKKSYYLLERTLDKTISNITADQIYTGALLNAGEELELYDLNGNLIDKVSCLKNQEGKCINWFGGNKDLKASMERINPANSGGEYQNWADNNQKTTNGLDAENNKVIGTPGRRNSNTLITISVPDDYPKISEAVNAAIWGDTIKVKNDIYDENITIEKQLTLKGIDSGWGKPVINGGWRGEAIKIKADGTAVEGFAIRDAPIGIYLSGSKNNIIKNNDFDAAYFGIQLDYSDFNSIIKNKINSKAYMWHAYSNGIYLNHSNNNILEENEANDIPEKADGFDAYNTHGIRLFHSDNNILKNNGAKNNKNRGDGINLESSNNNILENNTAAENARGIILNLSKNNTLNNNTAENNSVGIEISSSSKNILSGNKMAGNSIYNFAISEIRPNTSPEAVFDNDIDGANLVENKKIYYLKNQKGITVDSAEAGLVYCVNCDNVIIENLIIDGKNQTGILFYKTNNSVIENNAISDSPLAILLEESSSNAIKNNNVKLKNCGSGSCGIYINESNSYNNIQENNAFY